jgi:hypothetical protein
VAVEVAEKVKERGKANLPMKRAKEKAKKVKENPIPIKRVMARAMVKTVMLTKKVKRVQIPFPMK